MSKLLKVQKWTFQKKWKIDNFEINSSYCAKQLYFNISICLRLQKPNSINLPFYMATVVVIYICKINPSYLYIHCSIFVMAKLTSTRLLHDSILWYSGFVSKMESTPIRELSSVTLWHNPSWHDHKQQIMSIWNYVLCSNPIVKANFNVDSIFVTILEFTMAMRKLHVFTFHAI